MEKVKEGVLYLVSTPIGNLGDITLRALEILKGSDCILCEDSRVSQKLLNAFDIKPERKIVYNDINKDQVSIKVISLLKEGKVISQITDAGTPLISDPGFVLVRRIIEEGLVAVPVPGVSAPIAALCVSGFSGHEFHFSSFPPRTGGEKYWNRLKGMHCVHIFFESPKRIADTLHHVKAVMGDLPAVVCRELTKFNEEIIRGSISEVVNVLEKREKIYGEITFLIDNTCESEEETDELPEGIRARIDRLMASGFRSKEIINILAIFDEGKLKKNKVYDYIIKRLP